MSITSIIKHAARVWLIMVIMAFVSFMFFPALSVGNEILRWIINIGITAAALIFTYANGGSMGEEQISYGEMLDRRVERGYAPTQDDRDRCYNRARGIAAFVLSALPWVILSMVVIVTGQGYDHEAAANAPEYLFPDPATLVLNTHQTVDVVARVCFGAFMGYYNMIDGIAPGLLDRLFLPLSFVYPLAFLIGYLTGPIQHRRKLKMIEEGKQKKLRRIRAAQRRKQRQQQPHQPKPEV